MENKKMVDIQDSMKCWQ